MSILLNDNLAIQAPKPIDAKYGPYASVAAANAAIVSTNRYAGLTVGVGTSTIVEYWYNGGVADGDLVLRDTGGGSGTVTSVGLTAPAIFTVGSSPITTSGTLSLTYSGTALPVVNGGTGTTTPALVAGTNVTITGTWPNNTINASGGGGSGTVTSVGLSAPSIFTVSSSPVTTSGTLTFTYSGLALPVANGGTGTTTPALVAGTNVTITGAWPNQTINAGDATGINPILAALVF